MIIPMHSGLEKTIKISSLILAIFSASWVLVAHSLTIEKRLTAVETTQNASVETNKDLTTAVRELTIEVTKLQSKLEK